ncbi:MAG: RtcB family protein [Planctomycetota bacterium]|nr:RtcB family protein [Planctomycetota bacterium]
MRALCHSTNVSASSCSRTAEVLSLARLEAEKGRDARVQFGTLGRGNHFLELQSDQSDRLWLMIHSGSCGIGQLIHSYHLQQCETGSTGLLYLDAATPSGRDYLNDLQWASKYAEQNRLAMLGRVVSILHHHFGVEPLIDTLIQSDHNHVRQETHGARQLLVHRKGAQAAHVGSPGVIPGSMGTSSFHVTGRGNAEALCSSAHGADRRLNRTEAKKSVTEKSLHTQMGNIWFDHRMASQLRDEAPTAYRDIHAVMRAQSDLTRIERELQPVLSYKGARR